MRIEYLYEHISIHAPVKGATRAFALSSVSCDISIHAPVKGATVVPKEDDNANPYFNPRSREGSDVV